MTFGHTHAIGRRQNDHASRAQSSLVTLNNRTQPSAPGEPR